MRNQQEFVGMLFLGHQLLVPLIVDGFISVNFFSVPESKVMDTLGITHTHTHTFTWDLYVISRLLLEPEISQSLIEFQDILFCNSQEAYFPLLCLSSAR